MRSTGMGSTGMGMGMGSTAASTGMGMGMGSTAASTGMGMGSSAQFQVATGSTRALAAARAATAC